MITKVNVFLHRYFYEIITLIFLSVLAYNFLFSYQLSFITFEKSLYSKILLSFGYGINPKDTYYIFDYVSLDGAPRTRFLSNFFLIIDVKFRMLALQYFPIHSSFSISWLLSLFFIPIFLFKFVSNITSSKLHAFIVSVMYLTTTGFMGPINMSFHPAKPIGNIFILLVLFLISIMYSKHHKVLSSKNFDPLRITLVIILFFGLFLDETMLLALVLPIVFSNDFPSKILKSPKIFIKENFIWLLPLFVYILMVGLILPPLIDKSVAITTGINIHFNFFDWAFNMNDNLMDPSSLLNNLYGNAKNAILFHITPFQSYNKYGFLSYCGAFACLAVLAVGIVKLVRSRKFLFLKFFFCAAIAIVIQTLLQSRHSVQTIEDTFYYGCLISLFLSIGFSFPVLELLRSSLMIKKGRSHIVVPLMSAIFGAFLLFYILFININNYLITNKAWRGESETILTHDYVFDVWKRRHEKDFLLKRMNSTTQKQELWFLEDLYHSNHKDIIGIFRGAAPKSPYIQELNKRKN